MATFFSNQNIGYWSSASNTMYGTLTGNVGRSGNTVTLSGMSLAITSSQSAYGTSSFTMTVNGTGTTKTINAPPTTMTLNNTSFNVSAAQTSASVGWSTSDGKSGSFTVTFPSGSVAPSGLSVSINSRTWNSVSLTGKVSSWGSPNTGADFYVGIMASNASSNWHDNAVSESGTGSQGSATSITRTINNSSQQTRGGYTARGCKAFKIGAYCSNGSMDTTIVHSTVYYFPPSPLTALSVTSQSGSNTANSVTVNFSTTGGNSTNNENVNVTTQYRYSTNNGTSWSDWANVGSAATPWTARTGSFTVPYNTATLLQTRQVYQSQASEVRQISFTSTSGSLPTIGSTTLVSSAWDRLTVKSSITSYGTPSSIDGRYVQAYISSPITKWSSSLPNVMSGDFTITGLIGCTEYTVHTYANNKVRQAGGATILVTTPPAPMDRIVLNENITIGTESAAKLTAYGSSANNAPDGTVKTQYRYSIGDDSDYTEWVDVDSTSESPGNGKAINLSGMPQSTMVYIQTRQYQEITNPGEPITSTFITKQTPASVGYSWNDTRDSLTITANAESAATRLQILYGYSDSSASIVIADENNSSYAFGNVAYPEHDDKAIFAKARIYYQDNSYDESETIVIPVPHPIIGVVRFPDGSQKYIVDIVERKSDNTVTPEWQSGQRVVKARPRQSSSS